jgi:hypothetical protein
MKKRLRPLPSDDNIRLVLPTSRDHNDPRTAPACSLILGHYVEPAQLDAVQWTDLKVDSYLLLVRDPKGGPARTVQLSRLLVQQFLALRQHSQARRPFGRPTAVAPSISQLLKSFLTRIGLGEYTPADFVAWSLAQSDSIRKSVVTA